LNQSSSVKADARSDVLLPTVAYWLEPFSVRALLPTAAATGAAGITEKDAATSSAD